MRLLLVLLPCLAAAAPATPPPHSITIIAHRGLSAGAPENTLAAFRQSVARGVAIIELDLRATSDGHLVVLHDETLDRTTDCSGRLAKFTLARIKACDAGAGERVPTLAEALDFVRTTPARLLLDVKSGTSLEPVLREIRAHRAEAKVIFGLRRAKDVARARTELPGVHVIAFVPEAVDAAAFTAAGAHIIRLWSDWVDADPTLVARTSSLGPQVWIMIGRRLPTKKRQWRELHARMIAAGPQGLITDRPDLVSAK